MKRCFLVLFFILLRQDLSYAMTLDSEAFREHSRPSHLVKIEGFLSVVAYRTVPLFSKTPLGDGETQKRLIKEFLYHDCRDLTQENLIDSWKKFLADDDPWAREICEKMEPKVTRNRFADFLFHFLNFLEEKGGQVFSSFSPQKRKTAPNPMKQAIQEYSQIHQDYFLFLPESAGIFRWAPECRFAGFSRRFLASYGVQDNNIWGRAICLEYALRAVARSMFCGEKYGDEVGTENVLGALTKIVPITEKRIAAGGEVVEGLKKVIGETVTSQELSFQVTAYLLAFLSGQIFQEEYIAINPCEARLKKTLEVSADLRDLFLHIYQLRPEGRSEAVSAFLCKV